MRDYQRKRVYTRENKQAWMQKDGVYLTKDECRAIVNRLDKGTCAPPSAIGSFVMIMIMVIRVQRYHGNQDSMVSW